MICDGSVCLQRESAPRHHALSNYSGGVTHYCLIHDVIVIMTSCVRVLQIASVDVTRLMTFIICCCPDVSHVSICCRLSEKREPTMTDQKDKQVENNWRSSSRQSMPNDHHFTTTLTTDASLTKTSELNIHSLHFFAAQIYTVSQKSSTSYFAKYLRAGLTDCKNFNGYRVRDNKRTQGCNQCFNF